MRPAEARAFKHCDKRNFSAALPPHETKPDDAPAPCEFFSGLIGGDFWAPPARQRKECVWRAAMALLD